MDLMIPIWISTRLSIRSLPAMPGGRGAFALLLALPLVVIGILALHVVETDYAVLRARQSTAAQETLRGIGTVARAVVERAADETVRRVLDVADRTGALRRAMLNEEIDFATLYRDGQRLFPPEDGEKILVMERQWLSVAAGAIANARGKLETSPQAWTWLPLQEEDGALVHCRREDARTEVCVLLPVLQLQGALTEVLASERHDEDWTLALVAPSDRNLWTLGNGNSAATERLSLHGPLQGWEARARLDPAGTVGRPPALTLATVIVPLVTVWLLFAWQMQRTQRARLADSRHRAEIAAQLSHELRTPLANLRLYAELIRHGADDAGTVREYCDVLDAEAERLSRLADNATAFARGEAAPRADHSVAEPDSQVRDVIERLGPLCTAANCPVTLHANAAAMRRFDAAAVEQILTNLIDNACKYASGQPIEVSTWIAPTDSGEWLYLTVRDQGPGLTAPLHPLVFEPMVRGSGTTPGFGLGLAAVRRLARANGGDARVEDARPGARFTVWLRLDAVTNNTNRSRGHRCES